MDRTVLKRNIQGRPENQTWDNSDARDDPGTPGGRSIPLDDEMGFGFLDASRADTQLRGGRFAPNVAAGAIGWDYRGIDGLGNVNKYSLPRLQGGGWISITLTWDRSINLVKGAGNTAAGSFEVANPAVPGSVDDSFTANPLADLDLYLMPAGANNIAQNIWSSVSTTYNVETIFFHLPAGDAGYEIWVRQANNVGAHYGIAWWADQAPATPAGAKQVEGNVWGDADSNGIHESGEANVQNVTVQLYTSGGTLVDTTTSDYYGNYDFEVAPGSYYVKVTAPYGDGFTGEGADSDVDTNGQTSPFTVSTTDITSLDAGLLSLPYGSISGQVWNDANDNGIQDSGEPGVANVQVTLNTSSGDYVTTAFTDSNGHYSFTDIAPSDYDVAFASPVNYSFSPKHQGSDGAVDCDAGSTGQTDVFSLALSENKAHLDAGLFLTGASFSDRVWFDSNGNGIQDMDEEGLADVTVDLYTSSHTLAGTTTTDEEGNYSFSSVTPGDYYIVVEAPNDYNFTTEGTGSDPTLDSDVDATGTSSAFTLSLGDNNINDDVGLNFFAATVGSTVNPSGLGQTVTFTAAVSYSQIGTAVPTGAVTFLDGTGTLATVALSSDTATFSTSALALGTHTITAIYGGDANYPSSTTDSLTQTVVAYLSTTSLTSSSSPTVVGQSVTFTATVSSVSPATDTPTGTVVFADNGEDVAAVGLDGSGVATFTTTDLWAGNHTITALYLGDDNFSSSTADPVTQVVDQASTNTTVASLLTTSVFGQAVTFTATVSAVSPGAGPEMGTLTFLDGSTPLFTDTPDGYGVLAFTTSGLSAGTHTITVVYGGDDNFLASRSGSIVQSVNQAGTSTSLTSSADPSVFGQSVTFTATISVTSPGAGMPSGIVTFKDGSTSLGTGNVAGGVATFATSSLTVANHPITAVYNGDANFLASTASALTQTVNRDSTTTAVASSLNPSVAGQSVTFTATVSASSPGSGTATGTVTFRDGASSIGTGLLSSGKASLSTSALAAGNHTITAVYGGDANFTASTSSTFIQTEIPTVPSTLVWTGGGSNNQWSTPGNWDKVLTPIAGDDLVFPTTTPGTSRTTNYNDIAAGTTFHSITFSGTGTLSYSINGNALGLTTGITNSAGVNTFGVNITIGAGSHTFTVAGGTTLTELGVVSGSGGVTESGGGTLVLSGNNTYSGNTVVNAGAIRALSNNALGNLPTETVKLNANATTLQLAGNIILTAAVTNSNTQAYTLIVENISGNNQATITQLTNSTWNFNADAGNLVISTTGAANVGAGSSFAFNGAGNATFTNNGTRQILGANTYLSAKGTGILSVTGNFSILVGGVTINSGATMLIGNGGSTNGTANQTGAITDNGALVFNISGAAGQSDVISGNGTVTQNGGGTLTLNKANTYSGGTTVNAGSLLAGNTNGSATGTGAVTVNSGGTLGGTGIITGAVTVYGGSVVSPGTGIGILTLGALDLSNGGTLRIQVSGYSTAGTSFDQLKVTGTLTLGGSLTLLLDLNGLSTHGIATRFVVDGSELGSFGTIWTMNNPFGFSPLVSYGTSLNVQL